MLPRVLSIAGSDSGGGAGIQADVKTVTALGGYAATVITALTAQNTLGVTGVFAVDADFVSEQLRAVLDEPIFDQLEQVRSSLPDGCADCSWRRMCGGGDLENRYSRERGFNNPSVYCATYQTLYRGICELLVRNGYPVAEVSRRFG